MDVFRKGVSPADMPLVLNVWRVQEQLRQLPRFTKTSVADGDGSPDSEGDFVRLTNVFSAMAQGPKPALPRPKVFEMLLQRHGLAELVGANSALKTQLVAFAMDVVQAQRATDGDDAAEWKNGYSHGFETGKWASAAKLPDANGPAAVAPAGGADARVSELEAEMARLFGNKSVPAPWLVELSDDMQYWGGIFAHAIAETARGVAVNGYSTEYWDDARTALESMRTRLLPYTRGYSIRPAVPAQRGQA
jgi:hypothetical protein